MLKSGECLNTCSAQDPFLNSDWLIPNKIDLCVLADTIKLRCLQTRKMTDTCT